MRKVTTITVRMDPALKQEAVAILQTLGLSTSDAITLFFKQISRDKGLRFLELPSDSPAIPENKSAVERPLDITAFQRVDGVWKKSERTNLE